MATTIRVIQEDTNHWYWQRIDNQQVKETSEMFGDADAALANVTVLYPEAEQIALVPLPDEMT